MVDADKVSRSDKRIINNSGKWKAYFNADQVIALERIAGSYLCELGYETSIRGDEDPASLQLRYWFVRDRVMSTLIFFRDWGWRGVPVFIRTVRVSLMQQQGNKE